MKHANSKKNNTYLKEVVQTEFTQMLNRKCKTDSYEQGTNKCPPNTDAKQSDDTTNKRTANKSVSNDNKSKKSGKLKEAVSSVLKSNTVIMKTGPDSAKVYVDNPEGEGILTYKLSKSDGKYRVEGGVSLSESEQNFIDKHIEEISKNIDSMKYVAVGDKDERKLELVGNPHTDNMKDRSKRENTPGTIEYWVAQQKKKQIKTK